LRVALAIELTEERERELTRLSRSKRTSVRLAQRAKIVLLAAQGRQKVIRANAHLSSKQKATLHQPVADRWIATRGLPSAAHATSCGRWRSSGAVAPLFAEYRTDVSIVKVERVNIRCNSRLN